MSKPLAVQRISLVRRILKKKERAGKIYSQIHALNARLVKIAAPGLEIPDDRTRRLYAVKDNFAERTAFKTCAIDRFELKEVKPPKPTR